MVTFSFIDEITIPGVYNELNYDYNKGSWVKRHVIKVIDKYHMKMNGIVLGPKEIYDISAYTEDNGSWKYELIGSENKYLHSDGKVYNEEVTDYPF